MIKLKDEKGAALVLTILIITLLMVTILGLFKQVTNTTKQITTMEKDIVSQHIAEMGVDYYHAYTESFLPNTISDISKITLPDIDIQEKVILDSQKNFVFWIESHELDPESSEENIIINFTSIGEAYGKTTTIDSSVTINIAESGE
ncbi:hypothetical protein D8M06_16845 [Oceanobacillus halophilus]|uniref:Type II secretion system protein n=2 Tax=Oceanobacillus halophilus TaxID=930130 RepID=A0A494ZUA5_9BACI|nr:hypothetical protein D8M06_16845 [Oceanobacillus halophilus]